MIKVNLLRDQTFRVRRVAIQPAGSRMGLVLVAILAVVAAGLGTWWYMIHRNIENLTLSRDQLQVEFIRLQGLKKEIDEFEKRKQLVQSKIDVVERLRNSQTGPVLLLNHVIQSIPTQGAMWLTALDHKGDRLQITGYAQRAELVPDFISNLSNTGFFQVVDLELLEEEKDGAKFSLLCIGTTRTSAD